MATDSSNGEDVNDFLKRIRELGDRRDSEDEERTRKLEEDILASREARRARRDERARSLSPQKDSPGGTPISLRSAVTSRPGTREGEEGNAESSQAAAFEKLTGKLANATAESPKSESPLGSRPAPVLSWQRRPKSMVSTSNEQLRSLSRNSRNEEAVEDENPVTSRDQIAARLGSKDPSWFKQTADRGAKSAALRKSEDSRLDSGPRMALPGMSASKDETKSSAIPEPVPEPQKSQPSAEQPALRDLSSPVDLSRSDSARSIGRLTSSTSTPSFSFHNRSSSIASNSSRIGELGAVDSPDHATSMSPSQGRLSPERRERTPSPTKGLGGFVQSAMLKREGSVSKRWSNQPGGLSRNNSTASARNSYTPRTTKEPAPSGISRESSPVSEELPSKSKIERADTEPAKLEKEPETAPVPKSSSTNDLSDPSQLQKEKQVTPPASPTKTFDQKRWSPTKSSWLESALKKQNDGSQPTPLPKPPVAEKKWPTVQGPGKVFDMDKSSKPPIINPKPTTLTPKSSTISPEDSQSPNAVEPEKPPPPAQESKPKVAEKPSSISSSAVSPSGVNPPTLDKPKPKPAPKEPLNLRAGLKPRPTSDKGNEKEELPFLNAMSKLRATRTQNYKAPDVLKGNILEGKSKLNITGGPVKNKQPDAFKESILEAKGSLKQSDTSPTSPQRPSSFHQRKDSVKLGDPVPLPSPTVKPQPKLSSSPSPTAKPQPEPSPSLPPAVKSQPKPLPSSREQTPSPTVQARPKPALSEPPPPATVQPRPKPPATEPAPSTLKTKKSSLADRFNPALASMLQRGPPPVGPSAGSSTPRAASRPTSEKQVESAGEGGTGPALTHMTKGRARGPKKRLPTQAKAPESAAPTSSTPVKAPTPAPIVKPKSPQPLKGSEIYDNNGKLPTKSQSNSEAPIPPLKPKSPQPLKKPDITIPQTNPSDVGKMPLKTENPNTVFETPKKTEKAKPPAPSKSPLLRSESTSSIKEDLKSPTTSTSNESPKVKEPPPIRSPSAAAMARSISKDSPASPIPTNKGVSTKPETAENGEEEESSFPSVRGAAAVWEQPIEPPKLTKSPIKLPTRNDETESPKPTRSPVKASPFTRTNADASASSNTQPQSRSLPTLPVRRSEEKPVERVVESPKPTRSPARVPTLTRNDEEVPASSSVNSQSRALPILPSRSPSPQARPTLNDSDSSRLLVEFFKGPFFRAPKVDFDILSILSSKPQGDLEPVKSTIEVSEISSYGKLRPIPREEEHIFSEENMFLCINRYEGRSGKMETEVYLWSGLHVPESAVEDAQLFARKVARENDGRLIRLQQGRETATFFQAIGGILITRRGSCDRIHANNPFMLCGRKCFGGVAFDEVDMQTSSLCSAFPYIASANGTVYLWKGRGASAEELGVARLVAFDISGGEVKEMQEGNESDAFFDALGGEVEYKWADYWHLKPSCRNYGTRLFKVDLQTRSKVVEMSLIQADLSPFEIYIVDAFFEFYIVLGSKAQSKRAEFQLALQFTQEYAILAVSVDDRPFIPVSSVILGGAPRDFKALFRTWEDSKTPTDWTPNRKPSLRLMGLNDAIEAVGV